ncbi:MAG: hypothetical protein VKK32_04550 [Candidatus Melainabacteria bacterium]|nr:hypothetical protein [Candidatus Melainabacteria bacterium]
MTTIGDNPVVRRAFQNLTSIVKGESSTNTPPPKYNPQEVQEALQKRCEKLMNEMKQGNLQPVEVPPEVVKYRNAIEQESSFTPEQKKLATDLVNFIPVIANDKDAHLAQEFTSLLD